MLGANLVLNSHEFVGFFQNKPLTFMLPPMGPIVTFWSIQLGESSKKLTIFQGRYSSKDHSKTITATGLERVHSYVHVAHAIYKVGLTKDLIHP